MQLNRCTLGSGPDLVLLHAFPSSHEMWLPVAEQLAQRYRVTLYDLRGLGKTPPGAAIVPMSDHAADLERVCKEAGIQKAVFAGISIGGYILFEFWRSYRARVRALVLCDTRAAADSDETRATRLNSVDEVLQRGTAQFIEGNLQKLLGETTRRNRLDIVDAARDTMRLSTTAGIAAVQRGMAARPDSTPTLATINVPTLLMCGEEDTVTPLAEMRAIQVQLKGSSFVPIPRAGHLSVFENPADSTKAIRNFLDGLRDDY
jgi:3-oxoadipate enol-lactonase